MMSTTMLCLYNVFMKQTWWSSSPALFCNNGESKPNILK